MGKSSGAFGSKGLTIVAVAVAGVLGGGGARTAAAGEAAEFVARGVGARAALAGPVARGEARIVHEIDGGATIVARDPRAAAPSASGYTAALTGNVAAFASAPARPVRLRAAEEASAIAALSTADREALLAALRATRTAAAANPEHVFVAPRPAAASFAASPFVSAAATRFGASLFDSLVQPGVDRRPGFHDTTEFLYGKIAVNVVFVSSTGGNHSFSAADREDALADLVEGLDMWAVDLPKAKLSFKYRTFRTTTSHDPIEESSDVRRHWAADALSQALGRPVDPNLHYEAAYDLNDSARRSLGCDWAFTCFFVKGAESLGDVWDGVSNPNGEFIFGNGQTAFTMLGGPYMVMPFSRILGIHFWNAPILSHEFGHLFYAVDEYEKYAQEGHTPSQRSGYFQVENGNLDHPHAQTDQNCIMRGSMRYVLDYVLDHAVSIFIWGDDHSWSFPVCRFTRGQMGYIDSDGDGVTDPHDVAPSLSLSSSIEGLGASRKLRVGGTTAVGARPNLNPYANTVHPSDRKRNLSLDSLASVRYRVDAGAWQSVALASATLPGKSISLAIPFASGRTSIRVEVEVKTATGQRTTQIITRTAP